MSLAVVGLPVGMSGQELSRVCWTSDFLTQFPDSRSWKPRTPQAVRPLCTTFERFHDNRDTHQEVASRSTTC